MLPCHPNMEPPINLAKEQNGEYPSYMVNINTGQAHHNNFKHKQIISKHSVRGNEQTKL